jgi:hypothetical protein
VTSSNTPCAHCRQIIAEAREFREAIGIANEVFTAAVHDAATGRLLRLVTGHNKIPQSGRNFLRDLLRATDTAPTHVAVGVGTNVPADGDTTLQTEVYRAVITQRIPDTSKLTTKLFIPSSAANGNTLSEAAILNAAAAGTLFSRVTFAGIPKTNLVTVTLTWVHLFSEVTIP